MSWLRACFSLEYNQCFLNTSCVPRLLSVTFCACGVSGGVGCGECVGWCVWGGGEISTLPFSTFLFSSLSLLFYLALSPHLFPGFSKTLLLTTQKRVRESLRIRHTLRLYMPCPRWREGEVVLRGPRIRSQIPDPQISWRWNVQQIYLKSGPVNTRTTLLTWRQERRRQDQAPWLNLTSVR